MDELTEDLLHSRHRLRATEEEKRGKEEEAAMVRLIMCLMIIRRYSFNVIADMHD